MNDIYLNMNVYYKGKDGTREFYFPIPEISKRYSVSPFFMRHSYLYRFVILRIDSYLTGRKIYNNKSDIEPEAVNYLRMIRDICAEKNIGLLVAIFPYLKPLDKYDEVQLLEYKVISKAVEDLGIAYINLYDHLPIKDFYALRNAGNDEIHPGSEGHAIISGIVYDFLFKKGDLRRKEY
jgi:hypothetical protein